MTAQKKTPAHSKKENTASALSLPNVEGGVSSVGGASSLDSSSLTPSDRKKSRKATVFMIIGIIIGIAGLIFIGTSIGYWMYQTEQAANMTPVEAAKRGVTGKIDLEHEVVELVDNPIDFEGLQAVNADIYAWLTVPGTNVDYPVLQSPTDDTYYLNHDYTGAYSEPGAIYSERVNLKDFNDPVTLLYGHNGYPEVMFTTLHNFENADFFNANEYFVVYTPGHILTYQIISSYVYDDRHIINTNDFTKEEVIVEYFEFVKDPSALYKNVRPGIELTPDSKIVQLSTCMTETVYDARRYLVTGVLVQDQLTR